MKKIMTIGMMTIMMIMGTTTGMAKTNVKANKKAVPHKEVVVKHSKNIVATKNCNCPTCIDLRKAAAAKKAKKHAASAAKKKAVMPASKKVAVKAPAKNTVAKKNVCSIPNCKACKINGHKG